MFCMYLYAAAHDKFRMSFVDTHYYFATFNFYVNVILIIIIQAVLHNMSVGWCN